MLFQGYEKRHSFEREKEHYCITLLSPIKQPIMEGTKNIRAIASGRRLDLQPIFGRKNLGERTDWILPFRRVGEGGASEA